MPGFNPAIQGFYKSRLDTIPQSIFKDDRDEKLHLRVVGEGMNASLDWDSPKVPQKPALINY